MAVIAVLAGMGALAVVVLAFLVGRLSAQVRRLSTELAAAVSRTGEAEAEARPQPMIAAPHDLRERQLVDTAAAAPADDVPVITGLSDSDDDFDVTARRVASVTLARPLIKVASLSYGLRRALDDEHRFKVRYAMRQEFRRQRKMRRRSKAGRAPSMGWRA